MKCAPGVWRLLAALLLLAGAGCNLLKMPQEPPRPTPLDPLWQERAFADHLRVFNSTEVEGRATGTQGFTRAAAYVAARMGEFGLQPVLQGDFRVLYPTSLNHPLSALLARAGADTLVFQPGFDFLPDGRSDSGSVAVQALLVDPDGAVGPPDWLDRSGAPPGFAVLLSTEKADPGYLQQLEAAGARAALVVGPLATTQAAAPIEGLVVVRVAPEAAAQLLGAAPAELDALQRRTAPYLQALPEPVLVRVTTDFQPAAGAINTMGYVAGRHPVLARELVIVCSDLDAAGWPAGVRAMDFAHFGTGPAALLELARNYAYFARTGQVPERTLMFSAWSGGRLGQAGLRAFLEHPTWAIDQIHAVVYVGLAPEEEEAVRALLAAYGIPLYAVPATPLFEGRTVLMPEAGRPPYAAARSRSLPPEPNLREVYAGALAAARHLAAEAHEIVLMESITPAPFQPAVEAEIPVPEG